ncbi:hypothetical protein [Halobacillus litoralis]|uniref:hypothetical protein n=1 Tax=Halobacillus litoralis TaxID=45668 RepID=UPI001CD75682|nr:hypothetical protein [Halobacillus litoralis]MCA1021504.1 hypothetical protein [Halobacillus litoralis]
MKFNWLKLAMLIVAALYTLGFVTWLMLGGNVVLVITDGLIALFFLYMYKTEDWKQENKDHTTTYSGK